jgi:phenylpropionate dioxygenase-like ring-hydroxylating dioxygenase large terminal subunit
MQVPAVHQSDGSSDGARDAIGEAATADPSPPVTSADSSLRTGMRQRDLRAWPRYEAAVLGFRNYWYPVAWSRDVGSRPRTFRLLGDPIMFRRERGKVNAFYDQCPHRGIPLSVGRQVFPGTWSCRYHGWTYDLETGVLRAALTDGPDSPICGKVRARTYPVEERAGLVWVWMGDGPPMVPVESDIPEEMLEPNAVVCGRITERPGNWRLAAENGYDEAHVTFLHRYGALVTTFDRMPAAMITHHGGNVEGPWLWRTPDLVIPEGDYPGLGRWPKPSFWKRRRARAKIAIRLPCAMVIQRPGTANYAWWEPVDEHTNRYVQLWLDHGSGVKALWSRLQYWLYRRWLWHIQFSNQDGEMIKLMPWSGPERLFRPDASIIAWRRLCEQARGEDHRTHGTAAAEADA